jgi:pimeloyl-ACP methyl ester carboxylesterase
MAFQKALAHRLAGVCRWIYDSSIKEGDTKPDEGLTLVRGVRKATSYGAIVDMGGRLVVVFRGTEPTVEDWTRDIEAAPVPFTVAGGVVGPSPTTLAGIAHSGFLLEMNDVLPDLVATLRAHHAGKPVLVTGHSQGGAVAVLAGIALKAAGITVDAVYTFEAARCGDQTLCDSVPTPCCRIEFANDVVPHVPPDGLLLEDRLSSLQAIALGLAELATAKPPPGAPAPSAATAGAALSLAEKAKATVASAKGLLAGLWSIVTGGAKVKEGLRAAGDGIRQLLADGAPRTLFDSVRRVGCTKYRSAGQLVYLDRTNPEPLTELSKADERALYFRRLKGLCSLSRSRDVHDLFEDHGVDAWRARLK